MELATSTQVFFGGAAGGLAGMGIGAPDFPVQLLCRHGWR